MLDLIKRSPERRETTVSLKAARRLTFDPLRLVFDVSDGVLHSDLQCGHQNQSDVKETVNVAALGTLLFLFLFFL